MTDLTDQYDSSGYVTESHGAGCPCCAPAEPAYVYDEPVYEEPVYDETYEEAAYEEPVYEGAAYEEPIYEEPIYEEPIYEEPVSAVSDVAPYGPGAVSLEPTYVEPSFAEPSAVSDVAAYGGGVPAEAAPIALVAESPQPAAPVDLAALLGESTVGGNADPGWTLVEPGWTPVEPSWSSPSLHEVLAGATIQPDVWGSSVTMVPTGQLMGGGVGIGDGGLAELFRPNFGGLAPQGSGDLGEISGIDTFVRRLSAQAYGNVLGGLL